MPDPRSHLASLVNDFEQLGNDSAVVAPYGLRLHTTSYSELARLTRRFAAELEGREIRKGDRALLLGENSGQWVASFFGCILRGVLPVPIDAASPDGFVSRVIAEVNPKLVVSDGERVKRLPETVPSLAIERLGQQITSQQATVIAGLRPDDPLQIVFTSGTTAAPKGIVHTHRNVLASLQPIEDEIAKYRRYEKPFHPIRVLHTLPLSHVFGQFMGLWTPPLIGMEVHYRSRLVAQELISYIKERRISVLAAVPRVLDLMEQHLLRSIPNLEARVAAAADWKAHAKWWHFRDVHRRFGFKFWALVCGGAALSARSEQFWNALGLVVVQGYGMTETTALVSLNHPFKLARGTVGQVLPGREVRLSEEGEVLVRGETISGVTWHGGAMRPAESEWLATGDLAELDEQGNLRFRGRKKDVIVTSSGLNIYPEDLEEALRYQAGVKAAAVIEVQGNAGPEPLAVLLASGETLDTATAAAAVEQANRNLAEFQQLRRWVLWPDPDFPRTSTGKVLRREIAGRIAQGGLDQAQAASGSSGLNLDSLGRVELQAQVEAQFGVTLDDRAIQNVQTESDVKDLVRQAAATPAVMRGSQKPLEHRYPKWPWTPLMQGLRSVFLEVIAIPLLRFLAKPKIRTRLMRLPSGPMLLVANHVTSYDAPFVLYALPGRLRRRVAIAMSGEMILDWRRARNQGHWFLNLLAPFEYWLVTALFNVFPLPQLSGFRRSFQHAGEAVDRGYSVLVFPEGRRSDDGTLQPFKSGAGLLWKELGVPALPVRIEGLGALKVERRGWFRSGRITVSAGNLLEPGSDEGPETLTRRLLEGVIGA